MSRHHDKSKSSFILNVNISTDPLKSTRQIDDKQDNDQYKSSWRGIE